MKIKSFDHITTLNLTYEHGVNPDVNDERKLGRILRQVFVRPPCFFSSNVNINRRLRPPCWLLGTQRSKSCLNGESTLPTNDAW